MNWLNERSNRDRLLLAGVFLIFSASTLAWVSRNHTPPPWDPSDHLRFAYDYYQPLAHFHLSAFSREFFEAEHFYPPLVHLITAGFFLILGPSLKAGILANLLSLAILMASIYWLGNRLFDPRAGTSAAKTSPRDDLRAPGTETIDSGKRGLLFSGSAMAAVICASYHFPAWLLHDAFLDFPLTAAVAGTFALLIRADDFSNARTAVQFGIAAGLGLLVKETFPFFFVLPAVYVLVRVALSGNRRAMVNLALAAMIAAAIASIWYVPHLGDIAKVYHINRQAAVEENEAPLFSFMSNVVYLQGLVSYQIQAVFGVIFGFGLLYSLRRRPRRYVMLYLWIGSGILGFTLLANKDMRYTIPILPAVALLSTSWVDDFSLRLPGFLNRFQFLNRDRLVKALHHLSNDRTQALFGHTIAVSMIVFSLLTFANAQWPRPGEGYYIDTPHFRWMVFARNYFQFDHHPDPADWRVPEIARTLAHLSAPTTRGLAAVSHDGSVRMPSMSAGTDPVRIGIFVNLPYLNPSSIAIYGRLLAHRGDPAPYKVEWLVEPDRLNLVPKCQYFVVRTDLDHAEGIAALEHYAEKLIHDNPGRYAPVARFPIPGSNSYTVIYKVEN